MTCESNEGTTSNLAWPQSKCVTEQMVLVFFLELLSVFLIGLSSPLWPSGCWGQDSKDLEALTFPLLFWCVFVVLMFLLSHFLLVEWGCLPCWGLLWLFGTKLSQLGNLDGLIDFFFLSLINPLLPKPPPKPLWGKKDFKCSLKVVFHYHYAKYHICRLAGGWH